MSKNNVLKSKLACSLSDILIVRKLRNVCCLFFTNYQKPIGIFRQIYWYFIYYRKASRTGAYQVYLYFDKMKNPIGYSSLQLKNGQIYITECIKPDYRGQGYGKQIIDLLLSIALKDKFTLIAEIWATNIRSITLHENAGFVFKSSYIKNDHELRIYYFEG